MTSPRPPSLPPSACAAWCRHILTSDWLTDETTANHRPPTLDLEILRSAPCLFLPSAGLARLLPPTRSRVGQVRYATSLANFADFSNTPNLDRVKSRTLPGCASFPLQECSRKIVHGRNTHYVHEKFQHAFSECIWVFWHFISPAKCFATQHST